MNVTLLQSIVRHYRDTSVVLFQEVTFAEPNSQRELTLFSRSWFLYHLSFSNIVSVLISYAKDLWVVEMIVESPKKDRDLHGRVN